MNGKRLVLTAAMIVAGIRMWEQVRGQAKTPFSQWAIGWGATFLFLAVISEVYETGAGMLAGTIVIGDFLVNGTSLFTDATKLVTGAETGNLPSNPFSSSTPTAAAAGSTPSGHGAGQGGPAITSPGVGGSTASAGAAIAGAALNTAGSVTP